MLRFFQLLVLASAVQAAVLVRAQEVEVANVRFTMVRAPLGSGGNWLEADVQIMARPLPDAPGPMVSRVRVNVLVGFELPAPTGGERRFEHYRAEAECAALEPGRTSVRFYLPPEMVKRDRIRGAPRFWGVELAVAGRAMAPSTAAYSSTLAAPEVRRSFIAVAGADAARNDGILLPQYLTPFIYEYPRATPSFVRPAAR